MIYLVFALVFLGLITALGSFLGRKKGEEEAPLIVNDSCSTCTGENDQCEQECMMEAATKEIEYYEDYTDEEAESFAEVMLTMRPNEVKGWNRSLILRGINMPNQIKDDFIALVND